MKFFLDLDLGNYTRGKVYYLGPKSSLTTIFWYVKEESTYPYYVLPLTRIETS